MPTVDAAAASAREPMDWEAMHREQQRQITASMAEDFKRRDKIRRQHLEDALAAMQPKPSTRTPKRSSNCAPACSACSRPLASSVQSIIVRAVTRDRAERLQCHILPTDDPVRAMNILRAAAGLQPLSDEHDDQGG